MPHLLSNAPTLINFSSGMVEGARNGGPVAFTHFIDKPALYRNYNTNVLQSHWCALLTPQVVLCNPRKHCTLLNCCRRDSARQLFACLLLHKVVICRMELMLAGLQYNQA
jgi:hypothetical protein